MLSLTKEVSMVTLKDIAREAGVSTMTVSRVINQKYSEVSDENIEKIQAIIKKLGYIPNSSARSLSSKSSKIISIMIPGSNNPLETPYNSTILGYVLQLIQDQGYNAMVHFIDEYSKITEHLHSWHAEGAIFLGVFDSDIQQIKENNQIPLIFTDSYSSIRQVINIGIDDYKGGLLAAEHFVINGHKELAFVAPAIRHSQVMQQRMDGFIDGLKKAGIFLPPERIIEKIDVESAADMVCNFSKKITGVFVPADQHAVELMDCLKKRGYQLPKDYSIIGFDDLPISQYITPRLTTIKQNIKQKAQYAVDILFQHLKDKNMPTQNIVLNVELVPRESVYKLN